MGDTSLSSHRAGFGVFCSKAISKSTAESAFADSANCSDYESCHCEVPEARQHIGHWSNALCHCERPKGASQSHSHGDQRNNNAITTSNAAHSPRNDKGYNPLPLGSKANQRGTSCVSLFPKRSGGEGGTQCRVRV